ncbi:MAG: hypothetical protein R2688_06690 [Fimbriimonadaceae bacterium]
MFFPKSKQGTALGIQAGVGNFGVSLVQFLTPMLLGVALYGQSQHFEDKKGASDIFLQNAAFIWVPFIVIGTIAA